MALVMTVVSLAAPLHVAEHVTTDCHTKACDRRVRAKAFEQRDYRLRHRCNHSVVACIDRAAHLHRVSPALMRARAWCESRLDPDASNGTHFGLFQFATSTWWRTPYARRGSVWSAKWASLGAAWMERMGMGGEWSCYPT